MKNYIQPGDTIVAPAPSGGVLSGAVVVIGRMVGIATTTEAVGVNVALKLTGVFELPKVSAQAWAVGAIVYWDTGASLATTVVGTNILLGVATEAAVNPSAVGRVRLQAAFSAAA